MKFIYIKVYKIKVLQILLFGFLNFLLNNLLIDLNIIWFFLWVIMHIFTFIETILKLITILQCFFILAVMLLIVSVINKMLRRLAINHIYYLSIIIIVIKIGVNINMVARYVWFIVCENRSELFTPSWTVGRLPLRGYRRHLSIISNLKINLSTALFINILLHI